MSMKLSYFVALSLSLYLLYSVNIAVGSDELPNNIGIKDLFLQFFCL